MLFANWCLFLGMLLLIMAVADSLLKVIPFSAAAIYMLLGIAAGPYGLTLLTFDLRVEKDVHILEMLTEVAVLVSLFVVGLKLPLRSTRASWKMPILLASVAMVITIVLMTAVGAWLGWSMAAAMLIASVLAPTDPVLASEVQVSDAQDRDALRFGLTAEGGLNDGTAFPFVMLALGLLGHHELGSNGLHWLGVDVLWAVIGGLALGWLCGAGFTHAVVALRHRNRSARGMESFIALGLIALTYGIAIHASVYGFLAVFVAGLGMRDVERRVAIGVSARQPTAALDDAPPAGVSNIALEFVEDLEKFAEMALMLVIGSLLTVEILTVRNAAIAACLLFLVRPIAVFATSIFSEWTVHQRRIGAWMGIRGVGSLYYLAYAFNHGLESDPLADSVGSAVLFTIAASVLLHGISATPVMAFYKKRGRKREGRQGDVA